MKKVIILKIIFILIISLKVALASESCISDLENLIVKRKESFDMAFRGAFFSKRIYVCEYCHQNVIRLFHFLKETSPDIDPGDFKVLYITSETWRMKKMDSEGFNVLKGRAGYTKNNITNFVNWKFHVVLEYEGRIYDLDYTNLPRPVDKRKYLKNFFLNKELVEISDGELKGDASELLLYEIPGEEYLAESIRSVDEIKFHWGIFKNYEPVILKSYFEAE